MSKDVFYVYENSTAFCTLSNEGNVMLTNIRACIGDDCRFVNLGISKEAEVNYSVSAKKSGEGDAVLRVTNSEVDERLELSYHVMDVPRLEIADFTLPEQAEYSGEYEVSFILHKVSAASPKDVCVRVGERIRQEFSVQTLDEDRGFAIRFHGKDLDVGDNPVRVDVSYKDLNGMVYSVAQEGSVRLEKVNVLQRIGIAFTNAVLWLNGLFEG
jgi:hypothetical protein